MQVLILFSGTKSIEQVFEQNGCKCYSVDIDNHFKPTFNVDILKWDYKKDLKSINIDYIHASPICKNYTRAKKIISREEINFSNSLINKTLEIINYFKSKNNNLKFTIENPIGSLKKTGLLNDYKMITTSYCKYGFPYQKNTHFWYDGFNLVLKDKCKRDCNKVINNDGIHHPVRIGYRGSYIKGKMVYYDNVQILDQQYYKELKKQPKYKGFNNTYFRYRIPKGLVTDIYNSLKKS